MVACSSLFSSSPSLVLRFTGTFPRAVDHGSHRPEPQTGDESVLQTAWCWGALTFPAAGLLLDALQLSCGTGNVSLWLGALGSQLQRSR